MMTGCAGACMLHYVSADAFVLQCNAMCTAFSCACILRMAGCEEQCIYCALDASSSHALPNAIYDGLQDAALQAYTYEGPLLYSDPQSHRVKRPRLGRCSFDANVRASEGGLHGAHFSDVRLTRNLHAACAGKHRIKGTLFMIQIGISELHTDQQARLASFLAGSLLPKREDKFIIQLQMFGLSNSSRRATCLWQAILTDMLRCRARSSHWS